MTRGTFIAVSGGEGSGKTSVLEALQARHPSFVMTREPGATPVGSAIRGVLLDHADLDPKPLTELFLFFADRAEHLEVVVEPSLAKGRTVVSDRYWMDTYAYQWHAAMGMKDDRAFRSLVEHAGFRDPDLWIWLDVDPKVGLTRRRGTGLFNRLDRKAVSFHRKVREGYGRLYRTAKFPKVRVDANQPFDSVVDAVERGIMKWCKKA